MAGIKDFAISRPETYMIDPKEITIKEEWNARKDYGDLEELANSILESGLRNPIRIYMDNGKPCLTDGFRRLKAVLSLIEQGHEIKAIRCLYEDKGYNEEKRVLDMLLCNDGKRLEPIEEANVIQRLVNFGWTQFQVASKIGKTQGYVCQRLKLLEAPVVVQNALAQGEITTSAVIDVLNNVPEAEQIAVVELAVETAKANGKKKAGSGEVKEVQSSSPTPPKNKETPAKRMKEWQRWMEEMSVMYKGHPQYEIMVKLNQYINGEISMLDFSDEIDFEDNGTLETDYQTESEMIAN